MWQDLQGLLHASLRGQNTWGTAALVFAATLALLSIRGWWEARQATRRLEEASRVGDITPQELRKYDGSDPFSPLFMAVQGTVYDVSKGRDFYGKGGAYEKFAGREVARALAKMTLDEADLCARVDDLTQRQRQTLQDWQEKLRKKYRVVGQVVAPVDLSLEELRGFDGSDPRRPIYLAIRGVVFDVTKGRDFYGPEGVYPFAGRECARAFALVSTDTADCRAGLEGLGAYELSTLRDWEEKFQGKYPVVGSVRSGGSEPKGGAPSEAKGGAQIEAEAKGGAQIEANGGAEGTAG